MDPHEHHSVPDYQAIMDRFVAACAADGRVIAASLYGSRARGAADEHSDLDLGVITTDEAYDDFVAGREEFVRLLGEPLFSEVFGSPVTLFVIYSGGEEVEFAFGRESELRLSHDGPSAILLDKKGILVGAIFARRLPAESEQVESLRRQISWFWHDLSHFNTAMARGRLWWAQGQLEALRRYCVNLARLRHDFADPDIGEEPYFKIENAMPVEQLSPLETTFCPMEEGALLDAALTIVEYYREVARPLAQTHGFAYPAALDRVMTARLEALLDARSQAD